MENKTLLNLKEFCAEYGFGMTKAREICKRPDCDFSVRLGAKIFVHRELFEEHLKKCAKYKIAI